MCLDQANGCEHAGTHIALDHGVAIPIAEVGVNDDDIEVVT